ncbi:protein DETOXIFICATION 42-like isoform X2 [Camellia sinensis]|uniref:protein DETOXIFICATION 42-like isoform X2 n=1 Tax=Camellia sinensis TaxID=4442 RepID=UPI001036C005|nr:protein DETOXIFICATION 42-like isoform X2 [Camellia sinensis]
MHFRFAYRLSLLVRLLRRIMRKQKLLQPECCRWDLGLRLAVVVGLRLQFGIFTNDKNVVHLISIGIPFVAATQPINSLVFVFDGVNFGASDFIYSAYSMVLVSVVSIASLFLLWKSHVFVGIWFGLTIFMGLRAFYGILRV